MISGSKQAAPGLPAGGDAPYCFKCRIAMRHSCTEDTASGGTLRVYQCVKCGRTQSLAISQDIVAAN